MPSDSCDLAIIGAGAAGLAAAIFAGEAKAAGARFVLLEGERRPGAKILASGGGRCNVTNQQLTPADYCGGSPPVIRNVLRGFDNHRAVEWFAELGVPLRLEADGKYFPATNQARTVLEALLGRAAALGVELQTAVRVHGIRPLREPVGGADADDGFLLTLARRAADGSTRHEKLQARRVILATGGLAMPRSGSDGAGLAMARRLGHVIVPTTPALCPLVLAPGPEPGGRFAELAGVSLPARLTLWERGGKRQVERTGSLLFTHFGLSGPVALDISRHWLRARLERPGDGPMLTMGHPDLASPEAAEAWLRVQAVRNPRWTPVRLLSDILPQRLARIMVQWAAEPQPGRDAPPAPAGQFSIRPVAGLGPQERRRLAAALARLPLPVTGDRGYGQAEATAGGVDLREVEPRTLESRRWRGLYFCGEILDVDGRLGGFNFQWAWASGARAGRAAAMAGRS